MAPEEIVAKIVVALPDAVVELKDLTGTQDHWEAVIVSAGFAGKSLIERHRIVFGALEDEMKGPIHALTIKTLTPDQSAD